jgi:hypothetical protein
VCSASSRLWAPARDSLPDGTVGERAPPPHAQHLLLPGNNGYFALRGKKTFLPLVGSFQHHNLSETSCTHDTENCFIINETKTHTVKRRYSVVYVSSFAGRSVVFRAKKRKKNNAVQGLFIISLYVVLFVPSACNFQ